MEGLKTALNTAWGGLVAWINVAAVNMHKINEGIAIVVGILTAVYLLCQIRKALNDNKTKLK